MSVQFQQLALLGMLLFVQPLSLQLRTVATQASQV
jgi:hypothetical protein